MFEFGYFLGRLGSIYNRLRVIPFGRYPIIIRGWYNVLFNRTPIYYVQQIDLFRKSKCMACPLNRGNWCDSTSYEEVEGEKVYGCGCYLPAKWTIPTEVCPLSKWGELKGELEWGEYIKEINDYYVNNYVKVYSEEDLELLNSIMGINDKVVDTKYVNSDIDLDNKYEPIVEVAINKKSL